MIYGLSEATAKRVNQLVRTFTSDANVFPGARNVPQVEMLKVTSDPPVAGLYLAHIMGYKDGLVTLSDDTVYFYPVEGDPVDFNIGVCRGQNEDDGKPVFLGLPNGATQWVKILCVNEGSGGFPGLVESYDGTSFSDLDGSTATITSTTPSGTVTVTPSSMAGITLGNSYLVVDGECNSQTITVIGPKTATGTVDITGDVVTGITIVDGGSGYTVAPSVTILDRVGAGATATAVLTSGVVTSVTIGSGGSDYVAPVVVFSDPPFTSFIADFGASAVSNPITGITVTTKGLGYHGTAPTISITDPTGSGATATAVLGPDGSRVLSVDIISGGMDYTSPTVTFSAPSGPGRPLTTATGTAVVGGPTTIWLGGIWVQFQPSDYEPIDNDVSEPVIYLARREVDEDGVPLYLCLGGTTSNIECQDGSGFHIYAGRIQSFTPAPTPSPSPSPSPSGSGPGPKPSPTPSPSPSPMPSPSPKPAPSPKPSPSPSPKPAPFAAKIIPAPMPSPNPHSKRSVE